MTPVKPGDYATIYSEMSLFFLRQFSFPVRVWCIVGEWFPKPDEPDLWDIYENTDEKLIKYLLSDASRINFSQRFY